MSQLQTDITWAMFASTTPYPILMAISHLIIAMWNACIVFLQVARLVIKEANQEVVEMMALFDEGACVQEAITTMMAQSDTADPANPWQMLIIARASTFVLLLRLSKKRVLHLEVDESFIASKLEVIRTGLILHVQHIPRLLPLPIGTHDTQLVRYTPMNPPYLWKEERADPQHEELIGTTAVPATPPSPAVNIGGERRSHRKKYVQLLAESALRRQMHLDRLGRGGATTGPKKPSTKTQGENMAKRKALANATNADPGLAEVNKDADGAPNQAFERETGVAESPVKQTRAGRTNHAGLSENVSMPNNMAQTGSLRRTGDSVQQLRRTGSQSSRRRRSQFGLYAQGLSGSEFSLVTKTGGGGE